jgi:hypothetical protein
VNTTIGASVVNSYVRFQNSVGEYASTIDVVDVVDVVLVNA